MLNKYNYIRGHFNERQNNNMETFIAFFDILGFKEIINNNDLTEVKKLIRLLIRDIQTAVSEEKFVSSNPGRCIPDLEQQKVNCLIVSDSIVLWTNSNSELDFLGLVNVCYKFYWTHLNYGVFPLRGCLTYCM